MMRKGYKNFNIVGKTSCLGLLALGLALVNPVSGFAFAEAVDERQSAPEDVNDQIMTTAATPSTVTISFSPSSASGSVTPIDSTNGDKAKVDVQATVNVKNSGGYSVYIGSSSSQLKNGSNIIDSVTSATTYANLPLNRWGYSFRAASSSTDKTVTDSYVAMPATLRSSALYSNNATSIADETKYFMLSFAARIGNDKPTGTYSNSVTMSVVSSPLEVTEFPSTLVNMQGMTTAICNNAPSGASKQLKDTRDNKYYWVSKLADGKCWMTQNLDLDLSTSTKLTTADSDVSTAGYTPTYSTITEADVSTILEDDAGQRSWSLGNYRITNPDASSSCGFGKAQAMDCMSQFTFYSTPTTANNDINAHYILGNHYQWNAATAGTGGTITSGTATNSICPKSWKLPTSAEYDTLVDKLGRTGSVNDITQAPFYGVRGGEVQQTPDLFRGAGDDGYYWSSTPDPNSGFYLSAYAFNFSDTGMIRSSDTYNRVNGFSVRCIAK